MCHRNRAVSLSSDDLDYYKKKFQKKLNLVLQTIGRIIIFQMNITKDVCLKQLWKDRNFKKINLMQTECYTRSKENTAYPF